MRFLGSLICVLTFSFAVNAAHSSAVELRIRPIIRAMALEIAFDRPWTALPNKRHWNAGLLDNVTEARFRLVEEVEKLPATLNLDRMALALSHELLHQMNEGEVSPDVRRLHAWAMSYLRRVGSGLQVRDVLADDAEFVLTSPGVASIRPELAGLYRDTLTEVLMRPRARGLAVAMNELEPMHQLLVTSRLGEQVKYFRLLAQTQDGCSAFLH